MEFKNGCVKIASYEISEKADFDIDILYEDGILRTLQSNLYRGISPADPVHDSSHGEKHLHILVEEVLALGNTIKKFLLLYNIHDPLI